MKLKSKSNVAKVYRKYVLSYNIFAAQKTLNLLWLPDYLMQLDLLIFCDVLTSGLNTIGIDYDNLVCIHRDSTPTQADYC